MRRQPEMEQGRPYPSAFVRRSDSHKWNAKRSSWREGVRGVHSLEFRGSQAARSQFGRRRLIFSRPPTMSGLRENRSVQVSRLTAASMSENEGSIFLRYHGAAARAAATSFLGLPCCQYHRTTMACVAKARSPQSPASGHSAARELAGVKDEIEPFAEPDAFGSADFATAKVDSVGFRCAGTDR